MSAFTKARGTTEPAFQIGAGAPAGNRTIEAGDADNPPAIRWNSSGACWEQSTDGVAWSPLISEASHRALRQLAHFVESNSPGDGFGAGPYYCETVYTSNVFPTSETWYETAAKLKRICRWEGTYNANKTLATEKWIVYQADGASPAADVSDAITYSGVTETSRSRTLVVH